MRRAALLLLVTACGATRTASAAPTAADRHFFEQKVRPLLAARCYGCHSARAGKHKGGLRLDNPASILAGGDSGPAVKPGKPGESILIKAVRYETRSEER